MCSTGTVELNLQNLISPAKVPEKCSLNMLDNVSKTYQKYDHSKSLFAQKSVRGWWPCYIEKDGKKQLGVSIAYIMAVKIRFFLLRPGNSFIHQRGMKINTTAFQGKVEMTLEIVNEKEVDERPAGKGRDEPNMNPKLNAPK